LLLFDIVFIFIVVRVRWNRITTKKRKYHINWKYFI